MIRPQEGELLGAARLGTVAPDALLDVRRCSVEDLSPPAPSVTLAPG